MRLSKLYKLKRHLRLLVTSFQFVDVTLDVSCVMLFAGRMVRVKNSGELTLYASM